MSTHADPPTAAQPPIQPPIQPPPPAPRVPARPAWYRRSWVVAIAALLVGVGIGSAAAGTDPTTSIEYQQVAAQRDQARTDLGTARSRLADARARIAQVQGDLPAREARLKKAQKALAARQTAVSARAKAVAAKDRSVTAREKKVGIVERTIARNTIPGDGIYQVGTDIKAGTYKTTGAAGCYYAVLNSPNTSDIADNNNIDGPGILSVRAGQYLELSGCANWVWQQ